MASCVLQKVSGSGNFRGQHTVTWSYLYVGDGITADPLTAIELAQSTGPDPVPQYGAVLAGRFIFAKEFPAEMTPNRRDTWIIQAVFSAPEQGEEEENQDQPNPLERPAVYDIQYIEQEYVVKQARNVEELTGGPVSRAANTLGPIVNSCLRRPDEPIVDTERNAVILIERNYAFLGSIMELNETYQRTCNSDTCDIGGRSISARRLKYMVTRSGGRQVENGIVYYPGITEIELKKTTDLTFDNVGYEYWDALAGEHLPVLVGPEGAEVQVSDPVNLTLAGAVSTSTVTMTYRHLAEVAYAGFFP